MGLSRRLVAIVATVLVAGCTDTGPEVPSLAGQWLVTAYETDGVTASAVSGTADFQAGGTVVFNVLVTFPGEPEDTVAAGYGWSQDGDRLTLVDSVETSQWEVTAQSGGQTVVLALLDDASASRLTLARP